MGNEAIPLDPRVDIKGEEPRVPGSEIGPEDFLKEYDEKKEEPFVKAVEGENPELGRKLRAEGLGEKQAPVEPASDPGEALDDDTPWKIAN